MTINTQFLDVVGSCFSFVSTVYSIRAKVLTWLFTLIATVIGIVLYFHKGLYADVGLHVFYFVLGCYGWYKWRYGGKNKTELPISNLSYKMMSRVGVILLAGIVAVTLTLKFCTNSQVPLWDATTTVISIVAYWLSCRKITQSWILWFVDDALFSGMYFFKGIPVHGCLYMFYVILAVVGYLCWKKQMRIQTAEMELAIR